LAAAGFSAGSVHPAGSAAVAADCNTLQHTATREHITARKFAGTQAGHNTAAAAASAGVL